VLWQSRLRQRNLPDSDNLYDGDTYNLDVDEHFDDDSHEHNLDVVEHNLDDAWVPTE